MKEKRHAQAIREAPRSDPTLKRLDQLIGEWSTEISLPGDPPTVLSGRTDIEWLEEGPFLVQRGSVEHPDFPTGIAIIGGDDSTERYSMIYFDSRGVSRIYEMSLSNEVWKLWREAPGFSQRFMGTFSEDGNTITAQWKFSSDGTNWEHDFDLTYRKVSSAKV